MYTHKARYSKSKTPLVRLFYVIKSKAIFGSSDVQCNFAFLAVQLVLPANLALPFQAALLVVLILAINLLTVSNINELWQIECTIQAQGISLHCHLL